MFANLQFLPKRRFCMWHFVCEVWDIVLRFPSRGEARNNVRGVAKSWSARPVTWIVPNLCSKSLPGQSGLCLHGCTSDRSPSVLSKTVAERTFVLVWARVPREIALAWYTGVSRRITCVKWKVDTFSFIFRTLVDLVMWLLLAMWSENTLNVIDYVVGKP